MRDLSDIELLEAYAKDRAEEAFRELVVRHIDFIYSSTLRQLRNPHLAQEATQSAFIALAGKAGQVRRQTVVAGWLHRVAHFAALKLQRSEARRKHWEEQAATMNAPSANDQALQDQALPHIDGALAELTESDRDAVILRFLQQRSLREVAQTLGTTEEAAKKRVSRALERLRGLLARRGVAIPATLLAAGLAQMPVTAAPVTFSATLAGLAIDTAVSTGAATTTLQSFMTSTKLKLATVAGLVILGGSAALFWQQRANTAQAASNPLPVNTNQASSMRLKLTSVMVNDQEQALRFYTEVLGFQKKMDFPAGGARWLTVVAPDEEDGPELLLEPMGFPAAKTYQAALHQAGIPLTAFPVGDIQTEYDRMTKLGVNFTGKPAAMGPTTMAVLDDTCGNLIQLFEPPRTTNNAAAFGIKIRLTSVMVSDQEKALKFYTAMVGFVKKRDMPAGEGRWLTVVSPAEPDGMELVLEPMGFVPARTFQSALRTAGIPLTAFAAGDIQKEYDRMIKLGVVFTSKPTQMGPTTLAVFDDTCGNLIQIFQK